MINIKNITAAFHVIKDIKGETHSVKPDAIITIPRTLIDTDDLLRCVEMGYFIVFPNNDSAAVERDKANLDDRFNLIDLEQ